MENNERLFITLNNAFELFDNIYESFTNQKFKLKQLKLYFPQETALIVLISYYYIIEEPMIDFTRESLVNAILEVQHQTSKMLDEYKSV